MMIRISDFIFSILGLCLLLPFLILIYLIIIIESRGNGLFFQKRVGKNGKEFRLVKFRTMRNDSESKGLITVGGRDPRITNAGYFLRKLKLDELPQLLNVLVGEMSIVGPRPEVKKYVDLYNSEQKRVLSIRPGITDYASIEYVDENEILGRASNPELVYIQEIIPHKIELNMKYINNYTLTEYFKIIILTLKKIIL